MAHFDTKLLESLGTNDVALLGVPWDVHSSFLRGAALAPPQIRATLFNGAMNLCTEQGHDLGSSSRWLDCGDVVLPNDTMAALATIEHAAAQVLQRSARVFALGGDHAISYPLLRAYCAVYPDLTVLHLDAHPDLYDELDRDRYSHACPFARLMEEGNLKRLIQVGIRTLNPHQAEQARRFGVEQISMRDWHPGLDLRLTGPIYLSLDLDALDPAFAPGVSHQEPGGLCTRDVLGIIQQLPTTLVGADLVEFNPIRDTTGITAALTAKLVKEIVAKMVSQDT